MLEMSLITLFDKLTLLEQPLNRISHTPKITTTKHTYHHRSHSFLKKRESFPLAADTAEDKHRRITARRAK